MHERLNIPLIIEEARKRDPASIEDFKKKIRTHILNKKPLFIDGKEHQKLKDAFHILERMGFEHDVVILIAELTELEALEEISRAAAQPVSDGQVQVIQLQQLRLDELRQKFQNVNH